MTAVLEKVEQDALSLAQDERAFLADRLLTSLGGEVLSDVDAAWVTEAERRYDEYKQGKRQPVPASAVLAEADRMLRTPSSSPSNRRLFWSLP